MTKRRTAGGLLPLFLPTKPPFPARARMTAMNSINESARQVPQQARFDTDSQKFLIDSGGSTHLWNRRKDFVSFRVLSKQEQKEEQVLGINGKVSQPIGIGRIQIKIEDDENKVHKLQLDNVRYLPNAPLNIFVPQVFIQQRLSEGDPRASCGITATGITLQWSDPEDDQLVSKYVPLNKSNVGMCFTASGFRSFKAFAALLGMPATISDDESDQESEQPPDDDASIIDVTPQPKTLPQRSTQTDGITTDFATSPHVIPSEGDNEPLLKADQALLMKYHEQLGHCSFHQLKELAKLGIIPKKLAKVPPPKCPSCLYGKAHRRPWRTHKVDQSIKPATVPGAVVSVDQLESTVPGFVPLGREQPTKRRYAGATVFVDHASDWTYVHPQVRLTTEETLEAKHTFERVAEQYGVRILHYHADNGRFADKAFVDDVHAAQQTITFCGVSAHHQNGIAERRIRDITESARTMLLHAAHRWPKAISANLWPQAIKHAVNCRNALPRNGKDRSPVSMFANTTIEPNVKHYHPFGCPVYVLETPLQNQKSFPKWQERTRVGVFLCHSPHHAASVPLILNTQTGMVSPQFHCVFDDSFDTVKYDTHNPGLWQTKAHFHQIAEVTHDATHTDFLSTRPQRHQHTTPSLQPYGSNIPQALVELPALVHEATAPSPVTEPVEPDPPPAPNFPVNIAPTGQTRTGRAIRAPSRFAQAAYHCCCVAQRLIDGSIADFHPLTLLQMVATSFADIQQPDGYPDYMPLHVALAQPDQEKFIDAMERELLNHAKLKHWRIIHRSQVPRGAKPLPMIWTLRRKRDPAGKIKKWKARLCVGGHRQVYGDTYWTTFAPVVSWTTVRLVFLLAVLLGWHTRSLDFIMAYTQAKVKTDIFMELPKGTTILNVDPSKHLLKLEQNLYGLKDGQVTWHDHIKEGLLERGFHQSKVDPCLFIKGQALLTLYTDDAAILSPSASALDKEIKSLQESFNLTDEGVLQDYLGTRFFHHDDGTIELQ